MKFTKYKYYVLYINLLYKKKINNKKKKIIFIDGIIII